MNSSDLPFELLGGADENTAIHNRINAIARIKYLSGGIDLSQKNVDFIKALDLEMYKRWYSEGPKDKKIDEEFCLRAAEVVMAMEGNPKPLDVEEYSKAFNEYQQKKETDHVTLKSEGDPEDDGTSDKPEEDRVRDSPLGTSDSVPGKEPD